MTLVINYTSGMRDVHKGVRLITTYPQTEIVIHFEVGGQENIPLNKVRDYWVVDGSVAVM
jgi:hypothetical protein